MGALKGIGIAALAILGSVPGGAHASPSPRVQLLTAATTAEPTATVVVSGRVRGLTAASRVSVVLERQVRPGTWHAIARAPGTTGALRLSAPAATIPRWPVRVRLALVRRSGARITTSRWRSLGTPVSAPASLPTTPQRPALPVVPDRDRPSQPSGTLPVLSVQTEHGLPVASREEYLDADFTLDGTAFAGEIRGRGNSTWTMPKRPYRIKLSAKRTLLGMPSSKHWVLLADYADASLLRNELAFKLGESTVLAWTPRQRAVEVVLNGEFLGVYHLTEQIRTDPTRVALTPPSDGAAPTSGGYLLERDETLAEEPPVDCGASGSRPAGFWTEDGPPGGIGGSPIVVHEPECHSPDQLAYVKSVVDGFEARLRSDDFADPVDGYPGVIDGPSFVDWALVQIFTGNIDAGTRSAWFTLPMSGRLTMGPLWDFDLTFGSSYPVEQGWASDPVEPTDEPAVFAPGSWVGRLVQDPGFDAALRARWAELRGAAAALRPWLADRAAALTAAAASNDRLWPRPRGFATEVAALDSWIAARLAWMDTRFALAAPARR